MRKGSDRHRGGSSSPPRIIDPDADAQFRRRCLAEGWDPDAVDVGGYVDREWRVGSRHVFEDLFTIVQDKAVLEVGCHLGGTTVVLSTLGAKVYSFDPDAVAVSVARLNVARYGAEAILFEGAGVCAVDRALRFAEDRRFELVSCVSVLEYVPFEERPELFKAIDHALEPGGYLVISSSSNRLFPRELHGAGWANWLPRSIDRLLGDEPLRRGISPFEIVRAFPGYTDLFFERPDLVSRLKERQGWSRRRLAFVRAANALLGPLGLHAGYVLPNVLLVLRKPD